MIGYYKNVQASLFYFTKLFIAENVAVSPNLSGYKFDAHAQGAALPDADLIGPQGLSLTDHTGLATVAVQFLVCTRDDVNLFRLDDLVDALYDKLKPEKYLPLVDHQTGVPIGNFKVADGTTVFPIQRAENRPIKAIAVELKVDLSPSVPPPNGVSNWDQVATWDAQILWR